MTMTRKTTIAIMAMTLMLVAVIAWAQGGKPAAADPPAAGKGMHGNMGAHGMAPGAAHMGMGGEGMRSGAACACGRMGARGHGRMGAGMGRGPGAGLAMLHALDLTDAQREKVTAIHERVARKNVQTQADLRLAAMDLSKLMRADKPDARAVEAQVDKLAALRASIQKAHLGALIEVRALLTPEQQKKARELHGTMGLGGMEMGPGVGWGSDDEDDDAGDDGVEG